VQVDIIIIFKFALAIALLVALVLLIWALVEVIRILMSVRRVSNSVDLLLDIRRWFGWFRKRRHKKD